MNERSDPVMERSTAVERSAAAPGPFSDMNARLRALIGLEGDWRGDDGLGPPPKKPLSFVYAASRVFVGARALWIMATIAAAHAAIALQPWALGAMVAAVSAEGVAGADLARALGLFVLAVLIAPTLERLAEILNLRCAPDLRAGAKAWLFTHLLGHSPSFYLDKFAGRLAHKCMQAARATVTLHMTVTHSATKLAALLLAGGVVLATVDLWLGGFLLLWTMLFVLVTVTLGRRGVPLAEEAARASSYVQGRVVDALGNVELVRAFAASAAERAVVRRGLDDEVRTARRSRLFWIGLHQAQALMQAAFVGGAAAAAAWRAQAGVVDVGGVATTVTLAMIASGRVSFFAERLLDAFEQYGVLKEALELVTEDHAIVDRPRARPVPAFVADAPAIRFDQARFSYPDGAPVFDGFSLEVAKGEKIGVVGPSGAGKTTLLRLIRRDYLVERGSVAVAGVDLRDLIGEDLARKIAVVGQDAAVFHRSIKENIGYARASASDADIEAAARAAHCMEFVERRDTRFDTVIGERGVKLSGGERQRVAIARAMLKDAPILLLDEATSALDSRAERAVQEALVDLIVGRTVVAVAHRLSTLTRMNRIVVIDRGRLIEQGDHESLLARDGFYAELWRRQSGGYVA